MPGNFMASKRRGCYVLLILLLTPARPALAQTDTALARRLERDILALIADYPQPARDTILAEFVLLRARSHLDTAVAFARQHPITSVASLRRLTDGLEAAGRLRHALALIDATQGDSVGKGHAAGSAIKNFATLCAQPPLHTVPVFLAVVNATPDSLGERALQLAIRKARDDLGITAIHGDHCIGVLREGPFEEPAQLVVRDPDAILRVLDAPPRMPGWEYTLRMTAIRLGELRRFEDGFRVAARLRDENDRLEVRLRLAAGNGGSNDTSRTNSIVDEAKCSLDPQVHYRLVARFMIPLMHASGLDADALGWADSQPPGKRAFALLAIRMGRDLTP
jgi:hypothetical protein